MGLDADKIEAIDDEISIVRGNLQSSWADFAIFCKAKIMEATINGGITTYTLNGRTVTKDINWFKGAYEMAVKEANLETSGGISGIPISFRPRC